MSFFDFLCDPESLRTADSISSISLSPTVNILTSFKVTESTKIREKAEIFIDSFRS